MHMIPKPRGTYLPKPQRVVAIINPYSGRGLGKYVLNLLQNRDWEVEVSSYLTIPNSLDGHRAAIQNARDIGADRVLVCGGDGTLMETLTTMFESGDPLPLSLIPSGTGNIVAGDLDIPRRVLPAIRQAMKPAILTYWDMGELENTGQKFVLRASTGLEAQTLADMNQRHKRLLGTIAYALPGINKMLRSKPAQYKITIDDEQVIVHQGLGAFVAVTNLIVPSIVDVVIRHDIAPDDGMLHVGVVHPAELVKHVTRPQKFLREAPIQIVEGAVSATSLVSTYPVKTRVVIESSTPQPTQIDGELLDITPPLHFRNHPGVVPFVTPLS